MLEAQSIAKGKVLRSGPGVHKSAISALLTTPKHINMEHVFHEKVFNLLLFTVLRTFRRGSFCNSDPDYGVHVCEGLQQYNSIAAQ